MSCVCKSLYLKRSRSWIYGKWLHWHRTWTNSNDYYRLPPSISSPFFWVSLSELRQSRVCCTYTTTLVSCVFLICTCLLYWYCSRETTKTTIVSQVCGTQQLKRLSWNKKFQLIFQSRTAQIEKYHLNNCPQYLEETPSIL